MLKSIYVGMPVKFKTLQLVRARDYNDEEFVFDIPDCFGDTIFYISSEVKISSTPTWVAPIRFCDENPLLYRPKSYMSEYFVSLTNSKGEYQRFGTGIIPNISILFLEGADEVMENLYNSGINKSGEDMSLTLFQLRDKNNAKSCGFYYRDVDKLKKIAGEDNYPNILEAEQFNKENGYFNGYFLIEYAKKFTDINSLLAVLYNKSMKINHDWKTAVTTASKDTVLAVLKSQGIIPEEATDVILD